jgi:DNA-binding transcriptional MocR family regulator
VTFVAGRDFFADGSGGRSMRLAFSFVSPDEIAEGVARLAPLLAGSSSRRGSRATQTDVRLSRTS